MASKSGSSEQLLDITKCSICLDMFKEPKVLPCIHTFCLPCLETLCKDNDPGDEVQCPICRKSFSVPAGGIKDMQTNFFMNQLLQINQIEKSASVATQRQTLCETCSALDIERAATVHCIECEQHLCDRCSNAHKKLKASKSHEIVDMKDIPSAEERIKMAVSYCEEHPKEEIKLYCYDCKIVTCLMCYVKKHNKHECTDVKEAAEKFREQLETDIEKTSRYAVYRQKDMQKMDVERINFIATIMDNENKIVQRCDELVSQIKTHQSILIEKLNAFKEKHLKNMETSKDEVERQFVIVESFRRYCQEMKDKGTSCDVSRAAKDLRSRTIELCKNMDEYSPYKLCDLFLSFTPSPVIKNKGKDPIDYIIGELSFTDGKKKLVSRQNRDENQPIEPLVLPQGINVGVKQDGRTVRLNTDIQHAPGITGPIGFQGSIGPSGNTGSSGHTGSAGNTGPIGATGFTGLSASPVPQGQVRPQGFTAAPAKPVPRTITSTVAQFSKAHFAPAASAAPIRHASIRMHPFVRASGSRVGEALDNRTNTARSIDLDSQDYYQGASRIIAPFGNRIGPSGSISHQDIPPSSGHRGRISDQDYGHGSWISGEDYLDQDW